LLYDDEKGPFVGSHEDVIAFFNSCFDLIARSNGNPDSVEYKRAIEFLILPEIKELCLGYTAAGTEGSGAGKKMAILTAKGIWKAIRTGLRKISHFEEIALLQEGIGADRISDITAGILRKRISQYTFAICKKYDVPMKKFHFYKGYFDPSKQRWCPLDADLPHNPHTNNGVFLIPRRYLRSLPSINAEDFWDYCWSNENETIRRDFNYDISKSVPKAKIIQTAFNHPEFRASYIKYREQHPTSSYDFYKDESGLVKWPDSSKEYCSSHPVQVTLKSESHFIKSVDNIICEFRHFIEENDGWRLLWNDDKTPRQEKSAQLLFLGIIANYCRANDIDVSKEANIGRGPVDFKVSHGYRLRALLEVKLANNGRFWHGLEVQLPTYQKAESIGIGYFIIIVFSKKDLERLSAIQNVIDKVGKATGRTIKPLIVDASPSKPSASRA
jgi:hypothetical protein